MMRRTWESRRQQPEKVPFIWFIDTLKLFSGGFES